MTVQANVLAYLAHLPAHYERDQRWAVKGLSVAADRYTLLSPTVMSVNVNDVGYCLSAQSEIDLSAAASWDTVDPTDYTVAATRAGKDFYVYACQPASGIVPTLKVSANSTFPSGYNADNSRKICGFHCLCANVGTISGHSLTGFLAGDILPDSVWDLWHRPRCSPEGMVWSEKAQIWVDIYLQSGTGTATASVNGGTITDTRNWMDFVDDLGAVGKTLLSDAEFQLAAAGSNEETNIVGSADPVTTGGHSDTAGRRMISHIGCEDCCGAIWQWLRDQSFRCDPDGTTQAVAKTATITHVASPGGNPLYIKFFNDGTPYLCCNMATDAVNKIITIGTDYKLQITHDADPATGGLAVYFDEDATQPSRMLCNNTLLSKDCFVATNNPAFALQIKHSASAATLGVPVTYDDGADERLEFTSPTATNGTLDLALLSQGFAYYDLPGAKGSLYRQGTYGDVKLRAGGYWAAGSDCGSRARSANYWRWVTVSSISGRGRAEPKRAE